MNECDIPLPGARYATLLSGVDREAASGAVGLVYTHARRHKLTSLGYMVTLRRGEWPSLSKLDRSVQWSYTPTSRSNSNHD